MLMRRRQNSREVRQAFDIVCRNESIHVREHQAHAGGLRFEAIETQQRIQPDQFAAGLVQPLHGLWKVHAAIAIEAIADQQHLRVLAQHAPRYLSGQSVVVMNQPGASGAIGTLAVRNAPPEPSNAIE